MRGFIILFLVLVVALVLAVPMALPAAATVPDPILNPENGHYYELMDDLPSWLSWYDARNMAQSYIFMGMPGHLATITSPEEQTFVASLVPNESNAWLGGFQPPGSEEPAGGWQWVTGEPFSYDNWYYIEPNDWEGEDCIVLSKSPPYSGEWNDLSGVSVWPYIIEYEDLTPPELLCEPWVNPAGKKIPPAGTNPKSGANTDGFYKITATDLSDANPAIYIGTDSDPDLFGPFVSPVVIKFTEDPTGVPECKKIGSDASAVSWHVIMPSDPLITAVDASGNEATCNCVLLPPPPK